jgi:hypothetical protein
VFEQKNISELSITDLKALAYDHLVNIDASQQSLRVINARLGELINDAPKKEIKKDERKKEER